MSHNKFSLPGILGNLRGYAWSSSSSPPRGRGEAAPASPIHPDPSSTAEDRDPTKQDETICSSSVGDHEDTRTMTAQQQTPCRSSSSSSSSSSAAASAEETAMEQRFVATSITSTPPATNTPTTTICASTQVGNNDILFVGRTSELMRQYPPGNEWLLLYEQNWKMQNAWNNGSYRHAHDRRHELQRLEPLRRPPPFPSPRTCNNRIVTYPSWRSSDQGSASAGATTTTTAKDTTSRIMSEEGDAHNDGSQDEEFATWSSGIIAHVHRTNGRFLCLKGKIGDYDDQRGAGVSVLARADAIKRLQQRFQALYPKHRNDDRSTVTRRRAPTPTRAITPRPTAASQSSSADTTSQTTAWLDPLKVAAAIPPDASAIVHIYDRRVNLESHLQGGPCQNNATSNDGVPTNHNLPPTPSLYAMLRSWVQDDPDRCINTAGTKHDPLSELETVPIAMRQPAIIKKRKHSTLIAAAIQTDTTVENTEATTLPVDMCALVLAQQQQHRPSPSKVASPADLLTQQQAKWQQMRRFKRKQLHQKDQAILQGLKLRTSIDLNRYCQPKIETPAYIP